MNGALVCSFSLAFGDNVKTCAQMTMWENVCVYTTTTMTVSALVYKRGSRGFGSCFFYLLTRQISRLGTRIKECIRVESMMVGKPKMRNESKWDGRGQVKRVLAHSAGPNFFEGSERN